MKIALIGTTLFHQGAEYVLASLARGLHVRGHWVDVILSRTYADDMAAHPDWKPFELGEKIGLIVMKGRRARENVFELRNLMKTGGYDVILNHAAPYEIAMAVAGFGLRNGPKLIHVEHLSCIGVNADGTFRRRRRTLKNRVIDLIRRRIDAQFVVSSGIAKEKSETTGYPISKFYTVYNPVVDEVYRRKVRDEPKHPWLARPDKPVVVAAGIFRKLKGFHWLIQSFAEVRKHCDARLVIFGDGLERSYFEQLVHDNCLDNCVSLPGFTDNLPAELKGASCFVCASEVESFSVVLVEAMAGGVPVVSTRCPFGPEEILANGRYGELVDMFDRQGMADAIVRSLSPGGIVPPKQAVSPYTIEATLDRYEAAIEKVVKELQ